MYLFHVCFTEVSFCFMCSILALKLAFAFLFGCSSAAFQKTHPPATSVFFFNHQGASYGNIFHCLNFLKIVYSSNIAMTLPYWWPCSIVLSTDQYCDDSAVLMTLPYWWFCRIVLSTTSVWRRLCRIEDSAVLFCITRFLQFTPLWTSVKPHWPWEILFSSLRTIVPTSFAYHLFQRMGENNHQAKWTQANSLGSDQTRYNYSSKRIRIK